jgi:uncharacterized membrane protein YsdA (DUF1294 family)
MCYSLFFAFLSAILSGAAYVLLFDYTDWHPYLSWLVAVNGVTFLMYGIDTVFVKRGKAQTPEMALHVLSAAGGFVGGWLGRKLFGYKVDWSDRPWMQILLFLTTIGHLVLVYELLIKGPE